MQPEYWQCHEFRTARYLTKRVIERTVLCDQEPVRAIRAFGCARTSRREGDQSRLVGFDRRRGWRF
jgi:hypothetical protein